jgi:hypothetical protein
MRGRIFTVYGRIRTVSFDLRSSYFCMFLVIDKSDRSKHRQLQYFNMKYVNYIHQQ